MNRSVITLVVDELRNGTRFQPVRAGTSDITKKRERDRNRLPNDSRNDWHSKGDRAGDGRARNECRLSM